MNLPNKEQIAAATEAVRRAHAAIGYRRRLDDYDASTIAWAAICAVYMRELPARGQIEGKS